MALKLRKYASLWWENLIKKRAKTGKPKMRSLGEDEIKA